MRKKNMGSGDSRRLAECNQLLSSYVDQLRISEYNLKTCQSNLDKCQSNLDKCQSKLDKCQSELAVAKSGVIAESELITANKLKDNQLNSQIDKLYNLQYELEEANNKLADKNIELMAEYTRLTNLRTELITNIKSEYGKLVLDNIVEDPHKYIMLSTNGVQNVAIILGSDKLNWYTNDLIQDLSEEKKLLFLFDKNIINQIINIQTIVDSQILIDAVNTLIGYILDTYKVNLEVSVSNRGGKRNTINIDNIKTLNIQWIPKGKPFMITNTGGDEDLIIELDIIIA